MTPSLPRIAAEKNSSRANWSACSTFPADRAGFGVFDHAGPDGDAAAFAKRCKLAAASAYGTAGPEFVRRLIAGGVSGDDVRAIVRDFVAAKVPAGADGQVHRAAQRLGIIAAAGELATAFGLTGWREGEARGAAAWALKQWIEGRGGTEPAEVRQAIEQVRHFIEAHGEARFDSLDDPDARPVQNRAGWRKGAGEDRRWLILPEVWKSDVCGRPRSRNTSLAFWRIAACWRRQRRQSKGRENRRNVQARLCRHAAHLRRGRA